MKKLSTILAALSALSFAQAGAQNVLERADSIFRAGTDFKSCETVLKEALPSAGSGKGKAEVLWRLSRVYLVMGEQVTAKDAKRNLYGKGMDCADKAKKEDPSNPESYMWHSANLGREIQTRSVMEQAKKLPALTADLDMILVKLGKTEYSAAWQAYSEIYHSHPFKSNDAAINFARKATMCIPSGELRLSTYIYFANLLYERNWSAEKRKAAISAGASKFNDKGVGLIERYEYFDGSLGIAYKPRWAASTALGSMSDREEAVKVIDYAIGLYKSARALTPTDKADYKQLISIRQSWK